MRDPTDALAERLDDLVHDVVRNVLGTVVRIPSARTSACANGLRGTERVELVESTVGMFDKLPRHTCSTCRFWRRKAPVETEARYIEAPCLQPASPYHETVRRGSDGCSVWERRSGVTAPPRRL